MLRLLCFVLISLYIGYCGVDRASYISKETILENVNIQPKEALSIADKHLSQHGTFVWKKQEFLETYIVKKGKYYYIKRSDFPAKAIHWYLHSCIKINSKTGEISFVE